MGFSISWIGFHGLTKQEVLNRTGFRDTGKPVEGGKEEFSIAELPNSWIIVFSNNVMYADRGTMPDLSKGCRAIGCSAEEHVMVSETFYYEDGQELWSILHIEEIYDLTISGSPPDALDEIRQRLSKEQDEAGGSDANVDYLFDAPIEIASFVSGYRHDYWKFDWGEPRFTTLEPS